MSREYASYGGEEILKEEAEALRELDERLKKPVYKRWHGFTVEDKEVVKLDLYGAHVCDISPVRDLEHLEILNLNDTNVADLTPSRT